MCQSEMRAIIAQINLNLWLLMCLRPGNVYYNYIKDGQSSPGSLYGSPLPSFLFLIFNIQQLVINVRLWGICFASPAIRLMKTWQTDKQGRAQLAQRSKGHHPPPSTLPHTVFRLLPRAILRLPLPHLSM